MSKKEREDRQYRTLNNFESWIINEKGTEPPFSGKYCNHFEAGIYACKKCGKELFESGSKFHSGCGWPSFDDSIGDSIKETPDRDGLRTEIVCAACGAHLGHIFEGEMFTPKNKRHCVNSAAVTFTAADISDH